ncbi:MAG TPA: hypothetical protein DCZ48_06875 [Methylococcaceae bacterium]|nr:hypothetical protein [Methylococcaceae bacterium]
MANTIQDIRQSLYDARRHLMNKPNVIATGVGYKITGGVKTEELCITCSVSEKVNKADLTSSDMVPSAIEDTPTDVIQTKRFRVFQDTTGRFRPAPGGVSIGHIDISAGTLGCLVRKNGEFYILSNNHVLANVNAANVGDPIIQPGAHDGGKFPDDHIADLADFVPINISGMVPSDCNVAGVVADILNTYARFFGSSTRLQSVRAQATENLVDCAIAKPLQPDWVIDEILQIGTIEGIAEGELGIDVQKYGRTTRYTTGRIEQIDVTANVQLGGGRYAVFTDQLMAGAMSQPGDSGSAVLDMQGNIVGLLFAGSEETTLINRIQNVFSALGVSR